MKPASIPDVPLRPTGFQERAARRLLIALGPKLPPPTPSVPPPTLAPFDRFTIPRPGGSPGNGSSGRLAATWYPAEGQARGAVLLAHPWMEWGQSYFHRRGRIEALRQAGYHALTFDLGGFGGSGPAVDLWDLDVAAALAALRERAGGLPLHLWGVSSGGYWSLVLLSRPEGEGVAGAVFEDVSPHLIEWSAHTAPWGRPFYTVFRTFLRRAYRYLDLRRHAPSLRVQAAAFVGGELDRGIPAADTRQLARLAGAECLIVPGAGHLGAIKRETEAVIELALRTFRRAERREAGSPGAG